MQRAGSVVRYLCAAGSLGGAGWQLSSTRFGGKFEFRVHAHARPTTFNWAVSINKVGCDLKVGGYLTSRSSGHRYAAPLNSGVRPHGSSHDYI